jgi:hypothetical protein
MRVFGNKTSKSEFQYTTNRIKVPEMPAYLAFTASRSTQVFEKSNLLPAKKKVLDSYPLIYQRTWASKRVTPLDIVISEQSDTD